MKFDAAIHVHEHNTEELYHTFKPEITKKDRSGFYIIKEKDHLTFKIQAKDSVALRATLNSITKLLTVFEKATQHG